MLTPDRSPILRRLLKLPGQDADRDLQEFVDDQLLAPLLMLTVIGTICMVEWTHYWSKSTPSPWAYTTWFIGSALVIAFHWRKQWKVAMAKKLGRDGERAVAEFINVWLAADSRVLHNVPIEGGIADHVLVCRKGIFIIETKTRTLPRYGKPVVHISDSCLRVGGYRPDRDPITQVQRYVEGLRRALPGFKLADTGVSGIVVYPGWEIVDDRSSSSPVAVMNPKSLDVHLSGMQDVLSAERVSDLTRRIAQLACKADATHVSASPSVSKLPTLLPRGHRECFRGQVTPHGAEIGCFCCAATDFCPTPGDKPVSNFSEAACTAS